MLEKATQRHAENRYQAVQEFWDELADAALPPTRPLSAENLKAARRPSSELSIEPEEITEAPPKPRFELAQAPELAHAGLEPSKRPRIVVPVTIQQSLPGTESIHPRLQAKDIVAAFPDQSRISRATEIFVPAGSVASAGTSRSAKFLVALLLIVSFSECCWPYNTLRPNGTHCEGSPTLGSL